MRDPTWAGALTEVPPSSRSFSLMCARPVFYRPERAAVALGGSLLRRPTSAMGVRHSIGNLHVARLDLLRSARRPVGRRFASRLAAWLVPLARDRILYSLRSFPLCIATTLNPPDHDACCDLRGGSPCCWQMLALCRTNFVEQWLTLMWSLHRLQRSPSHKVSQATVAERAMRVFPHLSGLAGLFANYRY